MTISSQTESSAPREKTCESCGRAFLCNAGNCWCDSIQLDPTALSALRAKYHDCLCESCLRSAAQRLSNKQSNELAALAALPDSQIDLSDAPEVLDWTNASTGRFYRPARK